ncbi:hypothetical protein EPUS_04009 [Endocarpon pusillum Z07020]|uniref:Uncharacterized protein n=1 Tax=Endocarpon pusillum (strain Z07020 / HMAS-L-300199) TaxID=1263415 RepID=U1HK38_ENDPU|nr:uncharacterized protein EPUS_04009 [Endocarpon pusillum Z07020]ERF69304.1 hypothetical protein EPUS_04009 [Endocarpon pusillum Z07020]
MKMHGGSAESATDVGKTARKAAMLRHVGKSRQRYFFPQRIMQTDDHTLKAFVQEHHGSLNS